MKLNFGCGTNVLEGWKNFDAEIDITKPLPFQAGIASFIFAEHVVEHVEYERALSFFEECHRVLRPGGVIRIAVPSVEQIMQAATPEYCQFASKWARRRGDDSVRGAMSAILFAHGHRAPWTAGLLLTSLFYAGFDRVEPRTPGQSPHEELLNVEGHGRVIGDEFNRIETVVAEATK